MKIVINRPFGAFRLPDGFCRVHGIEFPYDDDWRYDQELIDWVETHNDSKLSVVSIPNEATDHCIEEYDGSEEVIYVLDGKLHWA